MMQKVIDRFSRIILKGLRTGNNLLDFGSKLFRFGGGLYSQSAFLLQMFQLCKEPLSMAFALIKAPHGGERFAVNIKYQKEPASNSWNKESRRMWSATHRQIAIENETCDP